MGDGAHIGYDVGEHFQDSENISKYGNGCYPPSKISIKYQKNWGIVLTVADDLRVLDAFSTMVMYPKMATKLQRNYGKLENVLTSGDNIT